MSVVSAETVIEQIRQLPLLEQRKVLQALQGDAASTSLAGSASSRSVSVGNAYIDRTAEYKWLEENEADYVGQWVALLGDQLIAQGQTAKEVYEQARLANATDALVVFVADPNESYLGW